MNKIKIIPIALFLFVLFSLFKISTVDINARKTNIDGGCYDIVDTGDGDTCGISTSCGGGYCVYNSSGGSSCLRAAKTITGLTSSSCQQYIGIYGGGTCTGNYKCCYNGSCSGSYTNSNCNGSCSHDCINEGYTYYYAAHTGWVNGMCTPYCPSGYHAATSGEKSSCSVLCNACGNSVGCVKDTSVYYCSGTTCASSTYASVAACTAAGKTYCTDSPVCNNKCAPATNPTYYYCNGTCVPTTDYATLSACNAALDSCHTSSNCDGECGNSWYFCRTDTTPQSCQATSATYATQAACNAALVKNWEGQTLNDTCYQFSSTCNSVCQDTDQCVTHDCSYIQGSCGTASGKSFSSSPTSYLCADGQVPIVYTSKNNFFWTCPATIVN